MNRKQRRKQAADERRAARRERRAEASRVRLERIRRNPYADFVGWPLCDSHFAIADGLPTDWREVVRVIESDPKRVVLSAGDVLQ